MKSKLFVFLICVVTPVLSFGQDLPDLGDVTEEEFPLARERVLGNALMRKIRSSDSYVLDPEILEYLDDLGHKLASRSSVPERYFEFFLINDSSINAFALPGGYVGVHSGLFLSSADESELAGVLGHEIAHIQQRHIARMLASQRKLGVASLAGLGLAILASRSSGQLAEAALATSQAAPLQAMLSFSRDHEREADRFGLGIMSSAGFNPVSAVTFFDRMYRETRVYQGALPGYMQTHPMTHERMADLQARLASVEVKQSESSLHYSLIKERIRLISEGGESAEKHFEELIEHGNYSEQVAGRYGRVIATLSRDAIDKDRENVARDDIAWLNGEFPVDVLILVAAAESSVKFGDLATGLQKYESALQLYPHRVSLLRGKSRLLKAMGRASELESFLTSVFNASQSISDPILYELRAWAYQALSLSMNYHSDLSMVAYLYGNLDAAIREIKLARDSDEQNFYLRSQIDSRLAELIAEKVEMEK